MKTLDYLVKKYFAHKHKGIVLNRVDSYFQQQKIFKELKNSLRGTQIYEDLKLEYINTYEDFVVHVDPKDFDFYAPYIEDQIAGKENTLFRGKLLSVGLTSGTSGQDSKRIPYNKRHMDAFLNSQRHVGAVVSHKAKDFNILTAPRLSFGSNPKCYEKDGVDYGYISGILSTKAPKILQKNTWPKGDVLSLENWEEKIDKLYEQVKTVDIKVVTGIPTYIIAIFEALLEKAGVDTISEIFPNLEVMVYGATPIDQYSERINRLVGKDLQYFGLYAATEAPLGIPTGDSEFCGEYYLNPEVLYSFSPVSRPKQVVGVHRLIPGEEYYVNVGLFNGFVHYAMKDIVKINERNDVITMTVMGRKSSGLNIAAEKTSDQQALNTIMELQKKTGLDIKHFFVTPNQDSDESFYQWTLFCPSKGAKSINEIETLLDQCLEVENADYKDCRDDNIIAKSRVKIVSPDYLEKYFERNREKGQFKMKTTFPAYTDFTSFLTEYFPQLVRI